MNVASGTFDFVMPFGGTGDDTGRGIAAHTDGSSVVTGGFEGTSAFGTTSRTSAGETDIFVFKVDSATGRWGQVLWAVRFGGSGDDVGNAIAAHADGSTVVTGYFEGTASFGAAGSLESAFRKDMFVVKLDAAGAVLWATRFGGLNDCIGNGIAALADGSSVVTGFFKATVSFGSYTLEAQGNEDIFLFKVDSVSGATLWANKYGRGFADIGRAVAVHADGSIVVTGYFGGYIDLAGLPSIAAHGQSFDGFVLKVNSEGTAMWITRFGLSARDEGCGIAARADGSTVVTGYYQQRATFGIGVETASAPSGNAGFVATVDSAGVFLEVLTLDSVGSDDDGFGVAVHADGIVTVVGHLDNSATLDGVSFTKGGFVNVVAFPSLAPLARTARAGSAHASRAPPGSTRTPSAPMPASRALGGSSSRQRARLPAPRAWRAGMRAQPPPAPTVRPASTPTRRR